MDDRTDNDHTSVSLVIIGRDHKHVILFKSEKTQKPQQYRPVCQDYKGGTIEICHDQRLCKIFSSYVNFSRKQQVS